MIELQYKTFKWQTLASCIVYIPTLIVIMVLVNTDRSHCYDSEVIYNNFEFNTKHVMLIVMGLISVVLSFNPNSIKGFEKCLDAKRV